MTAGRLGGYDLVLLDTAGRTTLDEAMRGAKLKVPTVDGPVMLTVAPGSGSGWVEPPPGKTSTMYCEKVSAKPLSGRAMIHARVSFQWGR